MQIKKKHYKVNYKKIFALVLFFTLTFTFMISMNNKTNINASTLNWNLNNITFEFNEDDRTLVVGGYGNLPEMNGFSQAIGEKISAVRVINIKFNGDSANGGLIFPENMNSYFWAFDNIETVSFENVDASNVKYMVNMFAVCNNLKDVDFTNFNPTGVEGMESMFDNCTSLEEVDISNFGYDLDDPGALNSLFNYCINLKSIKLVQDGVKIDGTNIETLSTMFSACNSLETIDLRCFDNLNNVTDASFMFFGCKKLKHLYLPDSLSNIESLDYMFDDCSIQKAIDNGLDIYKLFGDKTISTEGMFYASDLKEFDFSKALNLKAITLKEMFRECKKLKTINLKGIDVSNIISMQDMFYGCFNLDEIDISYLDFTTSTVTDGVDISGLLSYTNDVPIITKNITEGTEIKLSDKIENISFFFSGSSVDDNLDISFINDVGDGCIAHGLFYQCDNIVNFDVSWLTKRLYAFQCFSGCCNLETIKLYDEVTGNKFDPYEVEEMFSNCEKLQSVDLSHMTLDIDMDEDYEDFLCDLSEMFSYCYELNEVIFPSHKFEVAYYDWMFHESGKDLLLDLSNFCFIENEYFDPGALDLNDNISFEINILNNTKPNVKLGNLYKVIDKSTGDFVEYTQTFPYSDTPITLNYKYIPLSFNEKIYYVFTEYKDDFDDILTDDFSEFPLNYTSKSYYQQLEQILIIPNLFSEELVKNNILTQKEYEELINSFPIVLNYQRDDNLYYQFDMFNRIFLHDLLVYVDELERSGDFKLEVTDSACKDIVSEFIHAYLLPKIELVNAENKISIGDMIKIKVNNFTDKISGLFSKIYELYTSTWASYGESTYTLDSPSEFSKVSGEDNDNYDYYSVTFNRYHEVSATFNVNDPFDEQNVYAIDYKIDGALSVDDGFYTSIGTTSINSKIYSYLDYDDVMLRDGYYTLSYEIPQYDTTNQFLVRFSHINANPTVTSLKDPSHIDTWDDFDVGKIDNATNVNQFTVTIRVHKKGSNNYLKERFITKSYAYLSKVDYTDDEIIYTFDKELLEKMVREAYSCDNINDAINSIEIDVSNTSYAVFTDDIKIKYTSSGDENLFYYYSTRWSDDTYDEYTLEKGTTTIKYQNINDIVEKGFSLYINSDDLTEDNITDDFEIQIIIPKYHMVENKIKKKIYNKKEINTARISDDIGYDVNVLNATSSTYNNVIDAITYWNPIMASAEYNIKNSIDSKASDKYAIDTDIDVDINNGVIVNEVFNKAAFYKYEADEDTIVKFYLANIPDDYFITSLIAFAFDEDGNEIDSDDIFEEVIYSTNIQPIIDKITTDGYLSMLKPLLDTDFKFYDDDTNVWKEVDIKVNKGSGYICIVGNPNIDGSPCVIACKKQDTYIVDEELSADNYFEFVNSSDDEQTFYVKNTKLNVFSNPSSVTINKQTTPDPGPTPSGGGGGSGSRKKDTKEEQPPVVEPVKEVELKDTKDISYINGYNDKSFKPNNDMTRAEFIKVITTLMSDFNKDVDKKNYETYLLIYDDIDKDEWYATYIGYALKKGLVNGYSDSTFKPNGKITRAEVCKILSEIIELKEESQVNPFEKELSNRWYEAYVDKLVKAGKINGYPDGTFKPNNNITRAEVVSLVNRLFERTIDLDISTESKNAFKKIINDVFEKDWYYKDVVEATIDHFDKEFYNNNTKK